MRASLWSVKGGEDTVYMRLAISLLVACYKFPPNFLYFAAKKDSHFFFNRQPKVKLQWEPERRWKEKKCTFTFVVNWFKRRKKRATSSWKGQIREANLNTAAGNFRVPGTLPPRRTSQSLISITPASSRSLFSASSSPGPGHFYYLLFRIRSSFLDRLLLIV